MNYSRSHLIEAPPSMGKTLYIIGTSKSGPINEPIYITTIEEAISKFGDIFDSPIVKSYFEYKTGGGGAAYLMRCSGSVSSLILKGEIDVGDIDGEEVYALVDALEISTINGGDIYNTFKINLLSNAIEFIHPGEAIGNSTTIYLDDLNNLDELTKKINETFSGIIEVNTLEADALIGSIIWSNTSTVEFTGGSDGVNISKNDLYLLLEQTINLILGKHIDVITFADIKFDDMIPKWIDLDSIYGQLYYIENRDYLDMLDSYGRQAGFHKLAIDFCRSQLELGIFTHCIMGMNNVPDVVPDTYNAATLVIKATAIGNGDGLRDYSGGVWTDYGRYLSICYGDIYYLNNQNLEYKDNWYMQYAASWIGSNYNESLTAMPINITPANNFSDDIVNSLSSLGVVTYKFSPLNGWCISAGITTAIPGNALYLASNNKILQRVLSQLNADLSAYFDNPIEPIITNQSISKVVETSLQARKTEENIINDYDYRIVYNKITGITTIDIDLYTVYNTEVINATTSIFTNRS